MEPNREFLRGRSFIDLDTAICHALAILEHPFPTQFDTFPSDDPKLNILCEIGGDDFNYDLDLLIDVSFLFPDLPRKEQIAWAENIVSNARTEELKARTPEELVAVFTRVL